MATETALGLAHSSPRGFLILPSSGLLRRLPSSEHIGTRTLSHTLTTTNTTRKQTMSTEVNDMYEFTSNQDIVVKSDKDEFVDYNDDESILSTVSSLSADSAELMDRAIQLQDSPLLYQQQILIQDQHQNMTNIPLENCSFPIEIAIPMTFMKNSENETFHHSGSTESPPPPPPLETEGPSPAVPRPTFGKHAIPRSSNDVPIQNPYRKRFMGAFATRIIEHHPATSSCTSNITSLGSLGSTCSAPATIAAMTVPSWLALSEAKQHIDANKPFFSKFSKNQDELPLRPRACSTSALTLSTVKKKIKIRREVSRKESESDLPSPDDINNIIFCSKTVNNNSLVDVTGNEETVHNECRQSNEPKLRSTIDKHKMPPAPTIARYYSSTATTAEKNQFSLSNVFSAQVPSEPSQTQSAVPYYRRRGPSTSVSSHGGYTVASSHKQSFHDYHTNDPLLGNRLRRQVPRGSASVISVGSIVGQSVWITSPGSSIATTLAPIDQDTLVPTSTGCLVDKNSLEFYTGVMKANRRLNKILDDGSVRQRRHRTLMQREVHYWWNKVKLSLRKPKPACLVRSTKGYLT